MLRLPSSLSTPHLLQFFFFVGEPSRLLMFSGAFGSTGLVLHNDFVRRVVEVRLLKLGF